MEETFMTEGLAPGPDGSLLRFFYDSARNDTATNAEGRAIFDTVLMVDVITPGQKSSVPTFEVERSWAPQSLKAMPDLTSPTKRSMYYQRYFEQVEKFKRQEAPDMGGTPLKNWPRIDRGLIATLMSINIFTVEQLADISDGNLDKIGLGARELREHAKNFLEVASGTADTSQLTHKMADLEVENQRLREALALANAQATELQQRVAAIESGARQTSSALPDITLS